MLNITRRLKEEDLKTSAKQELEELKKYRSAQNKGLARIEKKQKLYSDLKRHKEEKFKKTKGEKEKEDLTKAIQLLSEEAQALETGEIAVRRELEHIETKIKLIFSEFEYDFEAYEDGEDLLEKGQQLIDHEKKE